MFTFKEALLMPSPVPLRLPPADLQHANCVRVQLCAPRQCKDGVTTAHHCRRSRKKKDFLPWEVLTQQNWVAKGSQQVGQLSWLQTGNSWIFPAKRWQGGLGRKKTNKQTTNKQIAEVEWEVQFWPILHVPSTAFLHPVLSTSLL